MLQRILNTLSTMRPRQLLMLAGVAGALMFATIFIGLKYIGSNEPQDKSLNENKPIVKMVHVVVAKTNIASGTRIQESMLQMREMPAESVPEGAIKNFDEVKNVQINVPIFAGDLLTIQKITAQSEDTGFTASIPADCRAVSINVNDVTGVAGFAKPGDHVDLLLVESGKYKASAEILLQNVQLLSINQNTTATAPRGETGIPKEAISNPTIATFALPPQDIVKLISATKIGEIYMSLRPSKPRNNYVGDTYYTMESIDAPKPVRESEPVRQTVPVIPANSPPPAAPMPQIPAAPSTPKIEIIAGDQIVQSSEPATPSTKPTPNAGGALTSQPLPVIPSNGVTPEFSKPPIPHSPLVEAPTVDSEN